MSRNYKMHNPHGVYFLSFATVGWVDVFTRRDYKNILINNLRYCIENKYLALHAWCIMTSHVHLIASAEDGGKLPDILRDYKKFTSKAVFAAMEANVQESRKEWMLPIFREAGQNNSANVNFQFWQQHNHPIELWSTKVTRQKLDYLHNNPVVEGFCCRPIEYPFSSAYDYFGGQGPLPLALLELP